MKAPSSEFSYEWPELSKFKLIAGSIVLMTLGFVTNFPLEDIVTSSIAKLGQSIPSCPMKIGNTSLTLFPPGFKLQELSVPSFCITKQGGNDLEFKNSSLKFAGLSFSPFGPMFTFKSHFLKNDFDIDIVPGISQHGIRLENQKLQISPIAELLGTGVQLEGTLNINALVKLDQSGPKQLNANIQSKNFTIPAQNIQGLKLPNLNLAILSIKTTSKENGAIFVEELLIGKDGSPIRAKFKGTINPSSVSFMYSNVNLDGEIFFSDEFKKSFALINMLMQKFPQVNGFYKVKIGGTLASPQFN